MRQLLDHDPFQHLVLNDFWYSRGRWPCSWINVPAAPGFASVTIAPQPGPLSWMRGELPHPRGRIAIDPLKVGV